MPLLYSYVVGICGPSASGKSSLAAQLQEHIGLDYCLILPMDSYYRDLNMEADELLKYNFDHPDALDIDLFLFHVRKLRLGHSVYRPQYNFETHSRSDQFILLSPRKIILIEGIFAFNWKYLRDQMHLKIGIEADHESCLERRINRDVCERNKNKEDIVRQYNEFVRPMADQYINPRLAHADFLLKSTQSIGEMADQIVPILKKKGALECV